MNARDRWQALQTHLSSTRAALDRGDRDAALAAVNAALHLDPDFLAAHSLRDRILAGELQSPAPPAVPAEPPPAPARLDSLYVDAPIAEASMAASAIAVPVIAAPEIDVPAIATPEIPPTAIVVPVAAAPIVQTASAGRPLVSQEGYAKFEQRAKRRRVDRRIDAARQAIEGKRMKQAAAALDEVIELDPNLPELADLTAQFDQLRRSMLASHRGPRIAATTVFAATVFCASWLQDSSPLFSRPMIASAPLLAAPTVSDDLLALGTTGTLREPAPADDAKPPAPRVPEPATLSPEPLQVAPPTVIPRPAVEAAVEPLRPPVALSAPPPPPPIVPPQRPVQESTVSEVFAAPIAKPIAAAIPPRVETVDDRMLVQQTLQRYRSAYEGLDAQSARAVWPAVNEVALARAFNGLESQTLTFDACDVRVRGEAATATCQGSARYVPKVGSREPRTEPRVWNFTLRKSGSDWKIDSARAER